jgi:CheY-like chemotaxis protein
VIFRSAINQQIALRTIRNLGYSVTAVWNGRESLDYLIAANTRDAPTPHPDVILMDVQMPVIDGYRTTHLIRHHDPYKTSSGTIPIIAMTASAIHGDREKCMRAGMNDYIAKPVKARTLEKTLDCWVIHGRAPCLSSEDEHTSNECNEDGELSCKYGGA